MDVVGVIDLSGGLAVHAVAGRRRDYRPVRPSSFTMPIGDALALARGYVEELGVRALYVADLDAIQGAGPDTTTLEAIARLGARVWVDAGVSSVERGRHLIDAGATDVIVGLESLPDYATLAAISAAIGDATAFSLDLRDGVPIETTANSAIPQVSAAAHAAQAVLAGVGTVIAIDLSRVGVGVGPDFPVLRTVRRSVDCPFLAGGGVRDADDLVALGAAGCDGALVASALLNGRVTREQVSKLRTAGSGTSLSVRSSPPRP